jgi:hypothetical protein
MPRVRLADGVVLAVAELDAGAVVCAQASGLGVGLLAAVGRVAVEGVRCGLALHWPASAFQELVPNV